MQASTAEALEYEAEVIKVIRGESKLGSELLNKLYEEAKTRAMDAEQLVEQLTENLQNNEQMKMALTEQFCNIKGWSELYDTCDLETKKMIVSHIFSSVRVKRNYEVEIDLTVDCEQLGIVLEEADMNGDKPIIVR